MMTRAGRGSGAADLLAARTCVAAGLNGERQENYPGRVRTAPAEAAQ